MNETTSILSGLVGAEKAATVVNRFGNLIAIARASSIELVGAGLTKRQAATIENAFQLGRQLVKEEAVGALIDSPAKAAALLRDEAIAYRVEVMKVILLNSRRRLISIETMATGTLDTILVHPREVFRSAIHANASSIIISHNHPSGDPTPSEADIRVTRELARAGKLLRIEVADHIIMGQRSWERERDFVSLMELGYMHI